MIDCMRGSSPMRWLVVVVAMGCHASAPASPDLASLGAPGLKALDPARLEATTRYLASDELAGRAPGSPGGIAAEDHVAKQFAAAGLEPAGDHGTYFQDVPMREATRIDAQSSLVFHGKGGDVALEPWTECVLFAFPHEAHVAIDAPLVLVGYGTRRPGYDDLAGKDLHGKIAIMSGGAPRELAGKPLGPADHAVLADTKKRTLALRERGAKAVLVVFDPARAVRMPFPLWATKVHASSMAWLEHAEPASLPVLPSIGISEAALDRLLASAGLPAKAPAPLEQL